MCRILHIETATEVCSVSLAHRGKIIALRETSEEKSHASILSVYVNELLESPAMKNIHLDAVAVSMGPGSYTGLRIGVSMAKGLCYGADIPLIAISTLEAMRNGLCEYLKKRKINIPTNALFSPMIDARRKEVYMALFSSDGKIFKEVVAQVVTAETFDELFVKHPIYFFGSGAKKLSSVVVNRNAVFITDYKHSSVYLASAANEKFIKRDFVDLAYFEPFYLKDFITTTSKKNRIFPSPNV